MRFRVRVGGLWGGAKGSGALAAAAPDRSNALDGGLAALAQSFEHENLRVLAVEGPLGRDSLGFDLGILLTWKAAVLAAGVMSLPLVVRTMRVAFEGVDPELEMMGRTLGWSRTATFRRVTLPLAARGLVGATLLGFTRALGEFGATVTLAGNIPGRTQTLASAIFSAQQVGDRARGDLLMGFALVLGFCAILAAETLARRRLPEGQR